MNLKLLWLLLPFSCMWLFFYLCINTLPASPIEDWWGIPLLITYAIGMIASMEFAVKKYKE